MCISKLDTKCYLYTIKGKVFFMSTEALQGSLRLLALETHTGNVSAC